MPTPWFHDAVALLFAISLCTLLVLPGIVFCFALIKGIRNRSELAKIAGQETSLAKEPQQALEEEDLRLPEF